MQKCQLVPSKNSEEEFQWTVELDSYVREAVGLKFPRNSFVVFGKSLFPARLQRELF